MKKLLLLFLFLPVMASAAGQVEINTASPEQLDELTGVGPAIAGRIIESRPYVSVDDLLRVKGIGEKTLQKIKDQGLAYVENPKTPEIQITKTYPGGIFINELLPSPEGADEANEFIELYNSNAFEVDLADWRLQDTQGTAGSYTFPTVTTIAAGSYLALKRPETKILLNNDQDSVSLLFPDGKITDTISYTGAPAKQSYSKTASGWSWSITPTAGQQNVTTTVAKTLPKAKKTDKKINVASTATLDKTVFTADLKKDDSQVSNPWALFATAAGITVTLGGVLLLIKLRVFKKDERS